tara:strand:+ start:309 stop:689 length:381 start_codon:yes stop_codon:yes gene_type:complete
MSTIRTNTLLAADGSTTTEPSIPALDQRMAKAWVHFNGTGTVAINGAYNVSSITDSATGSYIMNFTNNLADANFAVAGFSGRNSNPIVAGVADARSVSSLSVGTGNNNDAFAYVDVDSVAITVFGN